MSLADTGGARRLLSSYLRPHIARAAALLALVLCGIAAQLAGPQVLRAFVDTAQARGAQAAAAAALAFVALALAQRAAALGGAYLAEDLGWRTTNRLRRDLAARALELDLSFHKRNTPGALIERIEGDCAALHGLFAQFVVQVLGNGLLALGIIALVLAEDWRAGLGLAAYAAAVLAALAALQRLAARHWAALRAAITETRSFLEERIGAIETLRSSGAEADALAELARQTDAQLGRRRRAEIVSNLSFASTGFLFLLCYAGGLAVGAALYSDGRASIGTALMLVLYIGMLSSPLESIRREAQSLQQASASAARAAELLDERPGLSAPADARALPAGPLSVELQGVSFSYDDGDAPDAADGLLAARALHEVTFTLAPGQTLGLLGRTGSGKSTLARVVARLHDPTGGRALVGGVDLREVAPASLRARVGVVTQDVQIFHATLRENLRMFQGDISDAAIERALDQLGLLAWARALPQGLETPLGAGGLGLSAGEQQLLAFARVFLRDPGLIILDEASSRLDPHTEQLLEHAIARLLQGRTAIIIAHRLATVERADDILILERGQIAEHGRRAALAASPASRLAALRRVGIEEVLA